jgi:hypothetical protein
LSERTAQGEAHGVPPAASPRDLHVLHILPGRFRDLPGRLRVPPVASAISEISEIARATTRWGASDAAP